jgi:cytochrome c peroxidase
VRPPYMHDGRFQTLEQVVDFYDRGVRANPALDPRLRTPGGQPQRLNLTVTERDALVAFLKTLTDRTFLTDPRFSDPFVR